MKIVETLYDRDKHPGTITDVRYRYKIDTVATCPCCLYITHIVDDYLGNLYHCCERCLEYWQTDPLRELAAKHFERSEQK